MFKVVLIFACCAILNLRHVLMFFFMFSVARKNRPEVLLEFQSVSDSDQGHILSGLTFCILQSLSTVENSSKKAKR